MSSTTSTPLHLQILSRGSFAISSLFWRWVPGAPFPFSLSGIWRCRKVRVGTSVLGPRGPGPLLFFFGSSCGFFGAPLELRFRLRSWPYGWWYLRSSSDFHVRIRISAGSNHFHVTILVSGTISVGPNYFGSDARCSLCLNEAKFRWCCWLR